MKRAKNTRKPLEVSFHTFLLVVIPFLIISAFGLLAVLYMQAYESGVPIFAHHWALWELIPDIR